MESVVEYLYTIMMDSQIFAKRFARSGNQADGFHGWIYSFADA